MKLKSLLLFVMCCTLCYTANAAKLNLTDKISVEIPDQFKQGSQNQNKHFIYSGSTNNIYMSVYVSDRIKSDGNSQMSTSKVLKHLDTMVYTLEKYKFIEKKNESLLDLDSNYRIKKYENEENIIYTYTSYIGDTPYCLLFACDNDDTLSESEEIVNEIMGSITFKGSIFQWGLRAFNMAFLKWFILINLAMILASIIAPSESSWPLKITSSIITTILFSALIGFLTAWNSSLIIFFAPIFIITSILITWIGWESFLSLFDE